MLLSVSFQWTSPSTIHDACLKVSPVPKECNIYVASRTPAAWLDGWDQQDKFLVSADDTCTKLVATFAQPVSPPLFFFFLCTLL
jgi:hypothetical protein